MNHEVTEQQHRLLKRLTEFPDGATRAQLGKVAGPVVNPLLGGWVMEQKAPKGRSKLLRLTDAGREWIAEHPEYVKPKPPYSTALRLFMLELMLAGGSGTSAQLGNAPSAKDRKPLIDAKLLETAPAAKRATQFTLTDAGWKWVEDHLADPFEKGGAAERVLRKTLAAVQAFLAGRSLRLANFVRPGPVEASEPPATVPPDHDGHADGNGHHADLAAAIREACLELGGGKNRQGLRLADVRSRLGQFGRADQDRALLDLAQSQRLVLYGMDDPQEMKPDDRAAELRTPGGEPRHIVYWVGE